MIIQAETKFNIGDTVYAPEPYLSWIVPTEPSTVTGIQIRYQVTNGGKINQTISYELSNELFPCNEAMCFANFEECQRWCMKQNEKDGVL